MFVKKFHCWSGQFWREILFAGEILIQSTLQFACFQALPGTLNSPHLSDLWLSPALILKPKSNLCSYSWHQYYRFTKTILSIAFWEARMAIHRKKQCDFTNVHNSCNKRSRKQNRNWRKTSKPSEINRNRSVDSLRYSVSHRAYI